MGTKNPGTTVVRTPNEVLEICGEYGSRTHRTNLAKVSSAPADSPVGMGGL